MTQSKDFHTTHHFESGLFDKLVASIHDVYFILLQIEKTCLKYPKTINNLDSISSVHSSFPRLVSNCIPLKVDSYQIIVAIDRLKIYTFVLCGIHLQYHCTTANELVLSNASAAGLTFLKMVKKPPTKLMFHLDLHNGLVILNPLSFWGLFQ